MKFKRITVILLVIVMAMPTILAACSSDNAKSDKDSNQAIIEDGVEENSEEPVIEDIFAGLEAQTYDGREFNILAREDYVPQFYAAEETGDIINDAVYKRNRAVEDRFDVRINVIPNPGGWNEQTIRNSVMAGDGAYDLIDGYAAYVGNIVMSQLYLNLLEVPHLRLTEAWWSQHAVNELTINNKLFIVPGDITLNLWETIMVVFFSKDILKDHSLEDPYALVKNGDWTLDKFIEMCKGVSADLNGDGEMYEEDRYGSLLYDDLSFNNFHNAFDIPTTLKDAAGIPYFNLDSPDVYELAEKMYDFAAETGDIIYGNKAPGFKTQYSGGYPIVEMSLNMFANNQILFYLSTLSDAEKLRSMETDFGILPYPKRNKEQAQYKTSSRDQHTMFGIPVDVKDVDFVGHITEALCVASNKIVIPTYHDIALKDKFTRDEESQEMLDIIRAGLNFDFGIVFSSQLNSAGWVIRSCVNQTSFKFASTIERSLPNYQKALDKFLAALE